MSSIDHPDQAFGRLRASLEWDLAYYRRLEDKASAAFTEDTTRLYKYTAALDFVSGQDTTGDNARNILWVPKTLTQLELSIQWLLRDMREHEEERAEAHEKVVQLEGQLARLVGAQEPPRIPSMASETASELGVQPANEHHHHHNKKTNIKRRMRKMIRLARRQLKLK